MSRRAVNASVLGRAGPLAIAFIILMSATLSARGAPLQVAAAGFAAGFAITDVTVIDGRGGAPVPHRTVTIRDGRIVAIEPADAGPAPGLETVDGTGRFLIPGLWDMHAHLAYTGDVVAPVFLANGVTGVRDLGGSLEIVDWMRARITEGTLVGPRIFRAGPFVDGAKPGVPDRLVIDAAEDGRRAAAFLAERGVDFIKVHTAAPEAAYFALLEEARRRGIPVVGHLPHAVDPARAIAAGHASVEHIVALFEGPVRQEVLAGKPEAQAIAEFTDADAAALGKLMASRGTWFDPTLIAYRARTLHLNVPATDDPRYRYVSASLRAYWKLWPPLEDTPERRARLAEGWQRFLEIARIQRREGVRFLVGTDLAGTNIYPGFSVHDELEILVEEVGFTPLEAISAATLNSADSLGLLSELGTIEVGKLADLVLLAANPAEKIGNTRSINAVVADGRLYRQSELEAILVAAAAQAETR